MTYSLPRVYFATCAMHIQKCYEAAMLDEIMDTQGNLTKLLNDSLQRVAMEILLFNKRSAGILHESSDIYSYMPCQGSYVLVLFRASRPPSATPALWEGETTPLVQLFYTCYVCPSPHPRRISISQGTNESANIPRHLSTLSK